MWGVFFFLCQANVLSKQVSYYMFEVTCVSVRDNCFEGQWGNFQAAGD